jgi:hypothetical protein
MRCDKCGAEEETYLYEGLLLCKDCLNLFQGIETHDAPIEGLFEEDAYTKEERKYIDEIKKFYRKK